MLVSIKEYAQIHNLDYATVRSQVRYGKIPVAKREGRYTYIDSEFVYEHHQNYYKKYGKQPRLSNILRQMRSRCTNPNASHYANYGGRGIKVCDEWMKNSSNFIEWALSNGYKEGLTIDRIDVNGDYSPDNCQWLTIEDNNHKRKLDNKNK